MSLMISSIIVNLYMENSKPSFEATKLIPFSKLNMHKLQSEGADKWSK